MLNYTLWAKMTLARSALVTLYVKLGCGGETTSRNFLAFCGQPNQHKKSLDREMWFLRQNSVLLHTPFFHGSCAISEGRTFLSLPDIITSQPTPTQQPISFIYIAKSRIISGKYSIFRNCIKLLSCSLWRCS